MRRHGRLRAFSTSDDSRESEQETRRTSLDRSRNTFSRDRRGSSPRRDRRDRGTRSERRSLSRSRSRDRKRTQRFDSPPKESAVIANLHGLTEEASSYRKIRELTAVADAQAVSAKSEQIRLAKELYVGNIPQGIGVFALIDRFNDLLVQMGATTMPGKPILSGWLGGDNQFAFLQFRTVEECNHALALNGYTMDGYQLKVGRPKGALGIGGPVSVAGPATQFSLDDVPGIGLTVHPPLEESTKTELLALVGAPLDAIPEALERSLTEFGELTRFECIDMSHIERKTVLFEYSDVKSQRKIANKSLIYDRNFPLAVTRIEEAISAGFLNIQHEQFTSGSIVVPTRIVWLTNFSPVQLGLDQDLVSEVRETCGQFGQVTSVALHRVPKETLRTVCGIHSDSEPVMVVEFDNIQSAIRCTRYLAGASCFYMNETKFENSDFTTFEQNLLDRGPIDTPTLEEIVQPPSIMGGKIVSAEKHLLAEFKARKKHKLAPEDMEVID